jgi:hypothetical protein
MLPDQPRYLCSAMLKLDTAARKLDKNWLRSPPNSPAPRPDLAEIPRTD